MRELNNTQNTTTLTPEENFLNKTTILFNTKLKDELIIDKISKEIVIKLKNVLIGKSMNQVKRISKIIDSISIDYKEIKKAYYSKSEYGNENYNITFYLNNEYITTNEGFNVTLKSNEEGVINKDTILDSKDMYRVINENSLNEYKELTIEEVTILNKNFKDLFSYTDGLLRIINVAGYEKDILKTYLSSLDRKNINIFKDDNYGYNKQSRTKIKDFSYEYAKENKKKYIKKLINMKLINHFNEFYKGKNINQWAKIDKEIKEYVAKEIPEIKYITYSKKDINSWENHKFACRLNYSLVPCDDKVCHDVVNLEFRSFEKKFPTNEDIFKLDKKEFEIGDTCSLLLNNYLELEFYKLEKIAYKIETKMKQTKKIFNDITKYTFAKNILLEDLVENIQKYNNPFYNFRIYDLRMLKV